MTEKQVRNKIEEKNVTYIKLLFSDLHGLLKSVEVPSSQLDTILSGKIMFDGSSIEGLGRIDESDMYLKPDFSTFKVIPWEDALNGSYVGMFVCDIMDINNEPFKGDTRYILKKELENMKSFGFSTFNIGLEPEFFLFKEFNGDVNLNLTDKGGYFDAAPVDAANECRREIVLQLEKLGFEVEASHHEVSNSQHEINFKYSDAVQACDHVQIFKWAVKTIAAKHSMVATFMPKPIFGINGSGMHSNLSLFDEDGNNVFYDPQTADQLSTTANYFIGGLLEHAHAYTAVTNPTVNSYKRLVSGYEAPVYISYSQSNRSAMLRIPASRQAATRVEVRSVDATANPYLAMSVLLASGLYGIKNEVNPGKECEVNLFKSTKEEIESMGIEMLPKSLTVALRYLKDSEFMKEVLGELLFEKFIYSKRIEYDAYRREVHQWEIDNYISKY